MRQGESFVVFFLGMMIIFRAFFLTELQALNSGKYHRKIKEKGGLKLHKSRKLCIAGGRKGGGERAENGNIYISISLARKGKCFTKRERETERGEKAFKAAALVFLVVT